MPAPAAPLLRWWPTCRPPLLALGLALLAFGLSLRPLEPFLGGGWNLGSIATVLAVLRLGWWGLPVAAAQGLAASITIGPLFLPLALLEGAWLKLFLERINGGRRNADNGRVILADLVFWILVGGPLLLLSHGLPQVLESRAGLSLALIATVNHGVNTTLGFTFFLVLKQLFPHRMGVRGISIRGLSTSAVLLAIALPTLAVSTLLGQALSWTLQEAESQSLLRAADLVLSLPAAERLAPMDHLSEANDPIEFQLLLSNGRSLSSDPTLFRELDQHFVLYRGPLPAPLQLLLPRQPVPLPQRLEQGYWQTELFPDPDIPWEGPAIERVRVVQSSRQTLQTQRNRNLRSVGLVAWVFLLGALISDLLGRGLERQFSRVMAPILRHHLLQGSVVKGQLYTVPPLAMSFLRELNTMVKLINSRVNRVNRLTLDLQAMNRQLEQSRQELQLLSTTDPLTGCFNRRELHRRLEEEILRANRQSNALSCVCFDIDHFKQVNDTHGHGMGDAVLCTVAEVVRSRLRATDCFCRSGGEEFTILLPLCPEGAALTYAELLRETVAQSSTTLNGVTVAVTISLGVSTYTPGRNDPDQLLAQADRALYRAKEGGRNQVAVLAEEEEEGA
ncbi:MAG: GGDEF domain-containing protein [Prochlorococcaceae cyanobacterium]|jgi:diguanylate cyclase (GGDEF)-like protein